MMLVSMGASFVRDSLDEAAAAAAAATRASALALQLSQ